MKSVLLIDADSVIPNLALMKLSAFYKSLGYSVELLRLDLPYYPGRKKTQHVIATGKYSSIYCSVVFSGNREFVAGEGIQYGGTGVDLATSLPSTVEEMAPDYTIYPDNKFSYGFLSRGCIRRCPFCVVPEKEGAIRQVATVDDIVQHSSVKFLDNNFLALPNHKELLQELIDKRIKCEFTQGLDARLLDSENSALLSQLRYTGEYTFAFDDLALAPMIEKQLNLLSWRRDWQIKFFVYTHPAMSLDSVVRRVGWLRDQKCLPYIMRDKTCWGSEHQDFYTDVAAYCNQVWAFKSMDFGTFLTRRYPANSLRVESSHTKWLENKGAINNGNKTIL